MNMLWLQSHAPSAPELWFTMLSESLRSLKLDLSSHDPHQLDLYWLLSVLTKLLGLTQESLRFVVDLNLMQGGWPTGSALKLPDNYTKCWGDFLTSWWGRGWVSAFDWKQSRQFTAEAMSDFGHIWVGSSLSVAALLAAKNTRLPHSVCTVSSLFFVHLTYISDMAGPVSKSKYT